jgi:hypothetical protein
MPELLAEVSRRLHKSDGTLGQGAPLLVRGGPAARGVCPGEQQLPPILSCAQGTLSDFNQDDAYADQIGDEE